MGYVRVLNLIMLSKGKNEHSGLVSHWYGGRLTTTLMCAFFFVRVMLSGYKSKNKLVFMYPNYPPLLVPHSLLFSDYLLQKYLKTSDSVSENAFDDDFLYNIYTNYSPTIQST